MEQKLNQQEKLLTEAFNRIEKLETLLQKNVSHAPPSEFTSEPDMIDQNNSFYPHHSSMPPWIPFQYSPSPIFNQTANHSQNPLPFQSPPISYNQTSQPASSFQSPPIYYNQTSQQASSFQSPPSFLQPSVHVNQLENSKCLRIQCKSTTTALPSSVINKTKLVAASYTLDRFPKLQTESKVSNLAVKLARSSFFGEDVLAQCTLMGFGKYPALPTAELNDLKQTIFSLFPKYWSNPIEFETIWKDCGEAIGQVCKRLRTVVEKNSILIN